MVRLPCTNGISMVAWKKFIRYNFLLFIDNGLSVFTVHTWENATNYNLSVEKGTVLVLYSYHSPLFKCNICSVSIKTFWTV